MDTCAHIHQEMRFIYAQKHAAVEVRVLQMLSFLVRENQLREACAKAVCVFILSNLF